MKSLNYIFYRERDLGIYREYMIEFRYHFMKEYYYIMQLLYIYIFFFFKEVFLEISMKKKFIRFWIFFF